MDESWKTSLMTGDQCAVCEQPLDDESVQVEENGRILQVCGSCAIQRIGTEQTDDDQPDLLARQARSRLHIVDELLERRREEDAQLEGLRDFIEVLASSLTKSANRIAELEEEQRRMGDQLAEARERLHRMERTPKSQTGDTEADEAAPHFPSPVPTVTLGDNFSIEELQEVQKIFNQSEFTEKLRSVRRSLGRPLVHLDPVADDERVLVTIAWEIVWYQFLIDLSEEPTGDRVALFGEGMELSELGDRFREGNATLDDQGRIDASELEYELVREEGQVITDESPEQTALEDATEEVWDRHSSPEFRWDD